MIKIIKYIIIGLLIVGGILYHLWSVRQLENQIQSQQSAHNVHTAFLSDSLTNVVHSLDRKGDTLQKAKQTILSLENALQMGIIRENDLHNKYLKQVDIVVSLKEQIEILNKPGEYIGDTIILPAAPFTMQFKDRWYFAKVTAGTEFPVIDSMVFYNYPKLTAGWTKQPGLKNIFARPVAEVYYENLNPYATLKDIEYIKIDPVQKWYQTTAFKLGLGFFVGITTATFVFQ